jgi:hypothetical protein
MIIANHLNEKIFLIKELQEMQGGFNNANQSCTLNNKIIIRKRK